MKIRKFAVLSVLVFGTIAANDVAPSNSELEAMYDKAYRAFDAANYTEALKQLDAIDARKPDLAASQNLRGVVYMRQGLYDKAEAALSEARGLDPKFWNARFNLAEIPFLKKDWAEARKRFQDLLTTNAAELQGDATQLISPDSGTASQAYNEIGNPTTRTDSRGVLETYSYDGADRLTQLVYSQSGQPSQTFAANSAKYARGRISGPSVTPSQSVIEQASPLSFRPGVTPD